MNGQIARANLLLLFSAAIWGSAFVAQKVGMESMGPFWFTALRFIIGTLVVVPLLLWEKPVRPLTARDWITGIGIGLLLFAGINLQQVALLYTSVTNSGFITGLYVVLVPIISLAFGYRYGIGVWVGVVMAMAGLYLLSIRGDFSVNPGDMLTLISAGFWAFQVMALSSSGHCLPPIRLAVTQFATCAVLSLLIAVFVEPISFQAISDTAIPLLYGSIMSVGFGFTLQVLAQRHAHAAHSAIILSLESVFAALAGWFFMGDLIDGRILVGCALMLGGTLLAQLSPAFPPVQEAAPEEAA